MSDAVRRSLRTLFQAGSGAVLVELLVAFGVELSQRQSAALLAAFALLVSLVQNSLEDNVSSFPAILKSPASDGANPVPPPGGIT